jgi:hypothetical protein
MKNKKKLQVRRFVFSIFLFQWLIAGLSLTANPQNRSPELSWPQITKQNKPWTRWWWLGNIVNRQDLTVEMGKYQKAGLGGLEITPIYGVKGQEDRFIDFLSPAWMEMLTHTLKEAGRLGMGIDMATGTGWPFGGPWVGADDACKYFVHQTYTLKSGENLNAPLSYLQKPLVRAVGRRIDISELKEPISANDNLQALALDQVRFETQLPLQVLMAYSNRGETLDLTARVGKDGRLDWVAPAGSWTLYALFQGWHGKMVERAGPGGEGNVIDHFSAVSLKNYLNYFDRTFEGHDIKTLRAFFNDSYEVDDAQGEANWTPNFLAEFQRWRGYDLRGHLPALFGKDSAEKNTRVLCDYRETVSDLLLHEFTMPWRRWAASKGAITRNQAHGSPANILDLYAASDIPETEGQEILRMKFATSAAHVTGKQLASSEAATWLNEHTMATLGEVKQAVDKFFLGGVNQICYHGTPFSPESETWPGWLFYAAVHFGPTNPFWNDFATLNRYVARCQSFLQAGQPDNDLLLYYPIHDSWSQPAQPGRDLLQHYGGGIESALGLADGQMLIDAGHSFDLISDRQILNLNFNGETLHWGGAGSATYKAIVLPEIRHIPSGTFEKLVKLAHRGATIIVHKRLPADVPGFGDLDERRNDLQRLLAQLRFAKMSDADVQSAKVGYGRFLLGNDLKQVLELAGIKREQMVDQGLQFIRRKHLNSHYYFVLNQNNQPFDGWIPLRSSARAVAIFDPLREERGMAAIRTSETGGKEVYLQLAPGESCILKTFNRVVRGPSFGYFTTKGDPQPIDGVWSLSFVAGGPELPAAMEIDKLGSWTSYGGEALKSFSGTAKYAISFDKPVGETANWLLDLGRVAESARVILNGKELGTLIKAPYQIRIPRTLLKEKNSLEIAVTNLMSNRIADLDRNGVNWKKFYNINMPARRRENTGPDGLFNASRWAPLDSGLIGPVTLTPLEAVKFGR